MAGKGSHRRPASVPRKDIDEAWDKIFGKKVKKDTKKA